MRPYLTYIRTSLALTMRDRTVLVFNYFFPLIFFFIFGFIMHAEQGGAIVQIVTMVLTIGILGSGFFGAGMRTVMDREANILRRFKVAPISAAPILISQMVVGLVHYIPVTVLMLALAHFLYGMPVPENSGSLAVFVLIGVCAFRAMGSIIGAVANSMQESQIIIQLLYFPMLFLGGATFPISIMPNWLQMVSQFIPTTYLSLGLNGILGGHETIWQNRGAAGALLLTAIVGMFLAVKLFRWEKEEKMKGSAKAWLASEQLCTYKSGTLMEAGMNVARSNLIGMKRMSATWPAIAFYLTRRSKPSSTIQWTLGWKSSKEKSVTLISGRRRKAVFFLS